MPYPSLPLAEPLLKDAGSVRCGGKVLAVLTLVISSGLAVFFLGPEKGWQAQDDSDVVAMDVQVLDLDALWQRKETLEAAIDKLSLELRTVDLELKKKEVKTSMDEEVEQEEETEENLRGPRIWARCSEQDHLLDQFDRDTLQVALGKKSYLAIWDEALGHSWSGIPKPLAINLKGRQENQEHATLVALSPDSDYFYAQFGRDAHPETQFAGPENFTKALKQKPELCEVVTFGPREAWFIKWTDGRMQSSNLPHSLKELLAANPERSVHALSISGIDSVSQKIDDAAWFLRWSGHDKPGSAWRLRNGPSSLYATIDKVEREGGTVRNIEFGSAGEWILRYSSSADDGLYSGDYNTEC